MGCIKLVVPQVHSVPVESKRGGDNCDSNKKWRRFGEILLDPVDILSNLARSHSESTKNSSDLVEILPKFALVFGWIGLFGFWRREIETRPPRNWILNAPT